MFFQICEFFLPNLTAQICQHHVARCLVKGLLQGRYPAWLPTKVALWVLWELGHDVKLSDGEDETG
jgi:hypothetical protein